LTACKDFYVVAAHFEHFQRLFERARSLVVEAGRIHATSSAQCADSDATAGTTGAPSLI